MGIKTDGNGITILFLSHEITRFLVNKRNLEVHEYPVEPQVNVNVGDFGQVSSESVKIVVKDEKGNVLEVKNFEQKYDKKEAKNTVSHDYKFDDWSGNEDVISLCGKYLKELEDFISGAQTNGYITCE